MKAVEAASHHAGGKTVPNAAKSGKSGWFTIVLVFVFVPLGHWADQQDQREITQAKRNCGFVQAEGNDYFSNCSSRSVEVTIKVTALPDRTVCVQPSSTFNLGTASFVNSAYVSGPC